MNIGTNKCYCYQKETKLYYPYDGSEPKLRTVEYCAGTKEYDPCSCGGDPSKCDFYKRKKKGKEFMNTAEMWLKAQENGKIYQVVNGDCAYQKDKGLFDKDSGRDWMINAWDDEYDNVSGFQNLMKENWEICQNIMTKEEAEAKFNIKIVG